MLAAGTLAIVVIARAAGTDVALRDVDHAAIVSALGDGSDFYGLVDGLAATGGFAGRLIPLPTLALVERWTGLLGATVLLCATLASVLLTGWHRSGDFFAEWWGRCLGAAMLFAGATAGALLVMVEPHAGWCALIAGWSLLIRRRGRWVEAAALGCVAALIDPAAAVLAAMMGVAALREGQSHEAAGWGLAIAVAGVACAAHWVALAHAGLALIGAGARTTPLDLVLAALLPSVSPMLAAVALVLAIAGWCAVRGELAWRIAAVAIAGLLVAYLPGMQSAATLTLPLLPLGLVFGVQAVASLIAAARSRRRITVTRTIR